MFTNLLATAPTSGHSISIASVAVGLGVLAFILYRQLQIRVLPQKLVIAIVLGVVGVSSLSTATKAKPMTTTEIAVLVALLVFDAAGMGAIRAWTVRIWREGDSLVGKGSWITVALWLVGLGIHEVVDVAAHINSASLLLYLGVSLGAQGLVLNARAQNHSNPSWSGTASS